MKKSFVILVALTFVLIFAFSAAAAPFLMFYKGEERNVQTDFGFHVSAKEVTDKGPTVAPDSVVCFLVLEYNCYMANGMHTYPGPNFHKFPFHELVSLRFEFTDGTTATLHYHDCYYMNRSWNDELTKKHKTEYNSWGYYPMTENIFEGKIIREITTTIIDGTVFTVRNIDSPTKYIEISTELEKIVNKAIKKTDKERAKAQKKSKK